MDKASMKIRVLGVNVTYYILWIFQISIYAENLTVPKWHLCFLSKQQLKLRGNYHFPSAKKNRREFPHICCLLWQSTPGRRVPRRRNLKGDNVWLSSTWRISSSLTFLPASKGISRLGKQSCSSWQSSYSFSYLKKKKSFHSSFSQSAPPLC